MRQVLILTSVGGGDFSWTPGQVVELDDDQAAAWADGVRGRYLEPSDFILQHQQLTDDEVEQLKARFLEGVAQPRQIQVLEPTGTPAYVFDILDSWATGEPLDFGSHTVPEDVQARIAELTAGPAKEAGAEPTPPPLAGAGSSREAWAAYAQAAGVEFAGDAKRDDIVAACAAASVPTGRPAAESSP